MMMHAAASSSSPADSSPPPSQGSLLLPPCIRQVRSSDEAHPPASSPPPLLLLLPIRVKRRTIRVRPRISTLTYRVLRRTFRFVDFHLLLDDELGLLVKLRDSRIDWVQEGFQDFFKAIDDHFLILSGRNTSSSSNPDLTNISQRDKFLPGLILVLAQLCV